MTYEHIERIERTTCSATKIEVVQDDDDHRPAGNNTDYKHLSDSRTGNLVHQKGAERPVAVRSNFEGSIIGCIEE